MSDEQTLAADAVAVPVEPEADVEGSEISPEQTLENMRKLRSENKNRRVENKELKEAAVRHEAFQKLSDNDHDAISNFADMVAGNHRPDMVAWLEDNLERLRDIEEPVVAETEPAGLSKADIDKLLDERMNERFGQQDQKREEQRNIERVTAEIQAEATKHGYAINKADAGYARYRLLLQYTGEQDASLALADKITKAHELLVSEGISPQAQAADSQAMTATAPPDGEAPSGNRPTGTGRERALERLKALPNP